VPWARGKRTSGMGSFDPEVPVAPACAVRAVRATQHGWHNHSAEADLTAAAAAAIRHSLAEAATAETEAADVAAACIPREEQRRSSTPD
jgi:hypothetical protein